MNGTAANANYQAAASALAAQQQQQQQMLVAAQSQQQQLQQITSTVGGFTYTPAGYTNGTNGTQLLSTSPVETSAAAMYQGRPLAAAAYQPAINGTTSSPVTSTMGFLPPEMAASTQSYVAMQAAMGGTDKLSPQAGAQTAHLQGKARGR